MNTKALSVGLVVVAASVLSCKATTASSPADSASRATSPAASRPVAQMDGFTISAAEVDAKVRGKLLELEQQIYQTRRDALDQILSEHLIEREAKARGMSKESFLRSELDNKVPPPTDAEINSVYEANKARMGGRSLEEMKPQVVEYLRGRALAARAGELRRELAKKNNVKLLLEAPRFDVKAPATAHARGPATAPVTMVEFSDYQCPFCQRAEQTVEGLLTKYGDKLRFVIVDYPIEGHPGAFPAAKAARCAGDQGKFWEYHRSLLQQPGNFSEKDFKDRAASLGLKGEDFASCLAGDRHDAAIKHGLEQAASLGVQATPTFFINGRMISGAREAEVFESLIEEELSRPGE